jgi:hypothetical protein
MGIEPGGGERGAISHSLLHYRRIWCSHQEHEPESTFWSEGKLNEILLIEFGVRCELFRSLRKSANFISLATISRIGDADLASNQALSKVPAVWLGMD